MSKKIATLRLHCSCRKKKSRSNETNKNAVAEKAGSQNSISSSKADDQNQSIAGLGDSQQQAQEARLPQRVGRLAMSMCRCKAHDGPVNNDRALSPRLHLKQFDL